MPEFYAPFDLNHYAYFRNLGQPTVFWRRAAYEDLGGFDESYRLLGDCEFWLRAGAQWMLLRPCFRGGRGPIRPRRNASEEASRSAQGGVRSAERHPSRRSRQTSSLWIGPYSLGMEGALRPLLHRRPVGRCQKLVSVHQLVRRQLLAASRESLATPAARQGLAPRLVLHGRRRAVPAIARRTFFAREPSMTNGDASASDSIVGCPMRILILHSQYRSGWASGENSVVRDEERLLKEAGHEVVSWTPLPTSSMSSLKLGGRAVWSPAARAHLEDLMSEHHPDIVHCHNLFPMLSPAVLRASAAESSSIVVTLHNYRLFCLPATCFRDDEICELCVGHVPWRGVVYRCYRDSVLGSAALAASLTMHRAANSFDGVSLFLPVSRFVRDRHVAAGFDSERMVVKPNFLWPHARRQGAGGFFLYAGRLAPEKDVGRLAAGLEEDARSTTRHRW